ncbi:MAG: aminotransferase class IV [Verrucomicrobiales bacterium]|jgi:branched-subunit amino acid aminotransferase/4-amino-4-deoxychorismate lyase|nr:aminotransferase class IV [Verrucomicrobiales bacterium]
MTDESIGGFGQLKAELKGIYEMFGKKASVGIEDLGFRYGLGTFETLIVKSGTVQFRDWHEQNLREAAQALGIKLPDLSALTMTPRGTGIWRWFLTPSALHASFTPGLPALPESYRVAVSPLRLSSLAWESRYKTLSYLLHYQAWLERGSWDEMLLLNENSEIASAAMANVFWFKDGVLFTPELACGCRSGVIRRWVLENFSGEVRQVRSPLAALQSADEIFLTNSRIGVMPLTEFDGEPLVACPLTTKLRDQLTASKH